MIADLQDVRTLAELLQWRAARTPQGQAYRQYDPARSTWVGVSWQAMAEQVARFGRAFRG